jgi:MATE family multidrug resistance protein
LLVLLLLVVVIRLHVWYLPLIIDDPLVVAVAGDYLDGFSWGLPALLGMLLLRPYSEGLSFTQPHLVASLVSLLVNIPANYMLIFGHWGAPALGGAGAGWATALAFWAAFAVMVSYTIMHKTYVQAFIWRRLLPYEADELRHLLRVGAPIALMLFVEVSIFSLIALFLGVRPSSEIAAHQVAMNVAYLAFTLPFSISIAASIRVGRFQGAQDHRGAYNAARAAFLLALVTAAFNISILVLFADQIAAFYSNDAVVIQQATELLVFAALFQLADAFVVPAQGALRGYKDTRVPMLLAILAYWVITLPLGYVLGLTDILTPAMGAPGFWISLVVGLTTSGIFMSSRLWHISRYQLVSSNVP